MHCLAILIEGAGDQPVDALRGRTPLQVARAPSMHSLAHSGRCGTLDPPEARPGFLPVPLSLSLLGLPDRVRRSTCEWAASGGAHADDLQVCHASLVTMVDGTIRDEEVRLSFEETEVLAESLQGLLDDVEVRISSAGHLLFGVRDEEPIPNLAMVRQTRGKRLVDLLVGQDEPWPGRLARVADHLADHPINEVRVDLGENPANGIWPWGGGPTAPLAETEGGVLLANGPVARGAALIAGWEVLPLQTPGTVEDSRPAFDLPAVVEALRRRKNCLVAIDSPGFLGHFGGPSKKVRTLDLVDFYVVRHLRTLMDANRPRRVTLLADGAVCSQTGRPVTLPLPFVIMGDGVESDPVERFSEIDCRNGAWGQQPLAGFRDLVWNEC